MESDTPLERLLELRRLAIASKPAARPAGEPSRKALDVVISDDFRRALAKSGESFDTELIRAEGARKNAVVFSCLTYHALTFPEAWLAVYDNATDEEMPTHRALEFLRAMPNGLAETDLARFIINDMLLGGCYLHKDRSKGGRVLGLTPYTREHVTPVANQGRAERWVSHYRYKVGNDVEDWPAEDVIALTWPLVDPVTRWGAISPLDAIAQEYRQDTEMTRYATALIENDAITPTIITMPRAEGIIFNPDDAEAVGRRWQEVYSGDGRGTPAVLAPGMDVKRLSLNLEEMAFDALRRVPEARICSAFRVPAVLIGVNVGLENSTYSNHEEARKEFTQDTRVPLWRYVADKLTRGLATDFGEGWHYWHVLTDVAALQEDENERVTRQSALSARVQELQAAAASGVIARDAAIANAVSLLGLAPEDADALFPEPADPPQPEPAQPDPPQPEPTMPSPAMPPISPVPDSTDTPDDTTNAPE